MSLSQYETTGRLILYGLIAVIAAALVGGIIGLIIGVFAGNFLWWFTLGAVTGGCLMVVAVILLVLYARQVGWQ